LLAKKSLYLRKNNLLKNGKFPGLLMKSAFKNFLLLILLFSFKNLTAHDEIPGAPQTQPIALTNAKIYTVTQGVLENATVLFDKGKVVAVGKVVQIPDDAETIDCSGKSIYPGFITSASTLGLIEIEAVRATRDVTEVGAMNPNSLAQTAYNPDSEIIPTVRSNGILLAHVLPEGSTVPGRGSLMMMDGWTREDIALKPVTGLHVQWPRMTTITAWWMSKTPEEQRKDSEKRLEDIYALFSKAQAYSLAAKNGITEDARDIRFEAMRGIFENNQTVFISADEYKQILSVRDFVKKYNLRAVLIGGKDSWRATDVLNELNMPVIIQRTHALPMRDEESYDLSYKLPSLLAAAGVKFAFADEGAWQQRNLPFHAGTAMAFGLSEDEAVRALTLSAAEIFGVENTVGSLENGKDATLFVSSGNALDGLTNNVEFAFIQGRKVELTNRHTRLSDKYKARYRQQK
jgi:imidazolonepropionase-like amidohydrolase